MSDPEKKEEEKKKPDVKKKSTGPLSSMTLRTLLYFD